MKMKKLMALLLAVCTITGSLAGCGQEETSVPQDTSEKKENITEGSTDSASSSETETTPEEVNLYEEEVNLIWVQPTIESIEVNLNAIMEEINKITKEKINTTITLLPIPFAEYEQRLRMMYTAGEAWDVTHGGFCNPLATGVSMGAFAPIPLETLNTYAPEYMTHFDESVWEAVTFNGEIYATPIEQQWSNQFCAFFNEDLIEKYGFDYTKVKTLDDLDEFMAIVKENEPDIVPIKLEANSLSLMCNYFGWDPLVAHNVPGIVYDTAETPTAVNQFETDEFKSLLETTRRWYQAGYIPEDAATGGTSSSEKDFAVHLAVYVPGRRETYKNLYGFYLKEQPIGEISALKTSKIQEHTQVISSNCENIERAVAFINLLNTDQELLNLYLYGILGTDWEFADTETNVVKSISGHYAYDFFVGNTLNTYPNDPSAIGFGEEVLELNAKSKASPILGFTFNAEPVSAQIAQCIAITDEYLPGFVTGTVDASAEYDDFINNLKKAGMDDILAEMQKQIDEWLANR
ncbi:MAG: ABC transporter substrate-binding protein [Lachnospiraceae bacterium]|nr:ABC transporter substrate-binding protein [Lachnospiraceae bacterium]